MEINLIDFNMNIGKKKPHTMKGLRNQAECPFCAVDKLENIIEQVDDMILLKNKFTVLEPSDQLVLIEGSQCHSDMPDYSRQHMRKLIHFGVRHWLSMINSGKYRCTIFFKNYGPLSGGTIEHPHMQIVGFKDLNPKLTFDKEEFIGEPVASANGIELNVATRPRIGFCELNTVATDAAYAGFSEDLPFSSPTDAALDTIADYVQDSVTFMKEYFHRGMLSYNIFFYLVKGHICVKVLPRFATSPLFIGYNIHLKPTNISEVAKLMKKHMELVRS